LSRTIPYSRQSIDDDDIAAVIDVLKSDFLTQGPKVKEFEEALAEYCGFAATANAALYLGARPVFVDVKPDTGNIDVSLIDRAITGKTKALVPVHYAGHPVDLDAIHEIARRKNLIVIEDACHALGARYKERKIGSLSDMTVFSFHPVKPITTGEGGAVLTNDATYFKRLSTFRAHGITKEREMFQNAPDGAWYYEMQALGFNYRLTDLQAALGVTQLRKLSQFIQRRRHVVEEYERIFSNGSLFDLPREKRYARSSWHLYPIRLKEQFVAKKNEIARALREDGVGTQVHYIPVYKHPYYRELGYGGEACPVAEDFYRREISLPIYQDMTEKDIDAVRRAIHKVFL
jgi:dTDP-4-amino-4,6-dideoxygalactose transaminase